MQEVYGEEWTRITAIKNKNHEIGAMSTSKTFLKF